MPETHPDAVRNALPQLTQFDFHSHLADTRGVVLVAFSRAGCGSCRHLHRVFDELRRSCPEWHLYEVDVEREPGLVNEFEVFHLPGVFLFHDGEFHCPLVAEANTAAIVGAVTAALQQPAEEAP